MEKTKQAILDNTEMNWSGCWIWQRSKDRDGYGRARVGGKMQLAHRVVYELWIGEIPEGMHVCHFCDVPACCNPIHLFLGTDKDNMQDCAQKGRTARGEKHGRSILTETEVLEIRERLEAGELQEDIAAAYGVCQKAISNINTGRNWSWL